MDQEKYRVCSCGWVKRTTARGLQHHQTENNCKKELESSSVTTPYPEPMDEERRESCHTVDTEEGDNSANVNGEDLNDSTEDDSTESEENCDTQETESKQMDYKPNMKPTLPTIITGNVRCIRNKMDELTALTWCQREYQECSLMLFTETWLNVDLSVALDGFQLIKADRIRDMGKLDGGGVAVFVNNRWCDPNNITIIDKLCSRDIELLAVSMQPNYLLREFSQVIVIVAYVPPKADAQSARKALCSTVHRLKYEKTLILIAGDFNKAAHSSMLPEFTKYVNNPTRQDKILDLFYANIKEAYQSSPLPPLGNSDHDLVYLFPVNKSGVDRQPAASHTGKTLSDKMVKTLKDCFDTAWDVFCEDPGEDVESFLSSITDYINFWGDSNVPYKTERLLVNSKPWITPVIKTLLKKKRRIFESGYRMEMKIVQKELEEEIKEGKQRSQRRRKEE